MVPRALRKAGEFWLDGKNADCVPDAAGAAALRAESGGLMHSALHA